MSEKCCPHDADNCPHAAEAADHAVRKVFAILGVDVDVPKDVEDFRENLRFGASMRRAADKGVMAVVGIVAVGMMAALWAGIVTTLTKGGH